jgi:hypothetical protein
VQLTTDGWNHYPDAVEEAFRGHVDYVVINKSYVADPAPVEGRRRYSPPEIVTCSKSVVNGHPDLKKASTSIVERSNLSLRMGNRRFARLTNAFSKKLANHMHAISFYFMVYNFVKVHGSLRVTPAMAAGISDSLWTMEDIVLMADTMPAEKIETEAAAD